MNPLTYGGGEARDGAVKTTGTTPPLHHTETAMCAKTAKTLVAALVLASASIAFVADASAMPSKGPTPDEASWMNRPSGPVSGGYGG